MNKMAPVIFDVVLLSLKYYSYETKEVKLSLLNYVFNTIFCFFKPIFNFPKLIF